jgi:uncharacterized OB-fold protein
MHCGGEELAWEQVSGRGTIHSFSIARQATTRGFEADVPYLVLLVEIEEEPGLLLRTNLVGEADIDAVDIGQRVRVVFEERDEMLLPQFELAGETDV